MVTRGSHPCAGCAAHAAGLFCELDTPVGRRLQEQRTVHTFRRGQTIFHEGMEPTALFVISAGLVKLTSLWRGGEEHVLRLLGTGEFLGYRALLANEPYHANS
jgi:CRP-like cAMP-binding protein